MKDRIEHSGTVESIEDGVIRVRITQASACAGCTARSLCQSAESKDKLVDVATDGQGSDAPVVWTDGTGLRVGDRVVVYGSSEMGHKAVVLAFVVPLVLTVGMIAAGIQSLGLSEPASIGLAFLALALYYFILWTQRQRIQRQFVWRIKRFASEK